MCPVFVFANFRKQDFRSKNPSGVGTSVPCDITKGNQQVEKLQNRLSSFVKYILAE